MFDGIELVAKIERTTKKKAARQLIERGFSINMGEKAKKQFKRNWQPRNSARNYTLLALSWN
jgi:SOS response regulatory protein OraA/RecX